MLTRPSRALQTAMMASGHDEMRLTGFVIALQSRWHVRTVSNARPRPNTFCTTAKNFPAQANRRLERATVHRFFTRATRLLTSPLIEPGHPSTQWNGVPPCAFPSRSNLAFSLGTYVSTAPCASGSSKYTRASAIELAAPVGALSHAPTM